VTRKKRERDSEREGRNLGKEGRKPGLYKSGVRKKTQYSGYV
jgi:hypothetical protein